MIGREKRDIKEYVKSIVLDKIIFKDIVKLFGIKDTNLLRELIDIIASNLGMYLDYNSLSKRLNKDRRLIKDYIILLKESFLVIILGNYRKGKIASLRKVKRIYPVDSSIIFTFKNLIDESFQGKIVETVVINNLACYQFWKNGHEIDIIDNDIPIEIKYQNQIINKDLEGIKEFMRKFSVKKGILITKKDERKIKVTEGIIELIPVSKFLLEIK